VERWVGGNGGGGGGHQPGEEAARWKKKVVVGQIYTLASGRHVGTEAEPRVAGLFLRREWGRGREEEGDRGKEVIDGGGWNEVRKEKPRE
jgi:hypothetical protein